MPELDRILIVGGGIAGLTLARALSRKGFTAELVERSPTWRADGGGIAVQPNAMRMLRALDLDATVERAGARLQHWSFCDQQGEVLSDNDLGAVWRDVGPFIGIERVRLQRILVAGIGDIPCRLGMSIRSLSQCNDTVSVGFSDGSSGNYDLVVGADGISSDVRTATLGAVAPAYTGAMAWRSIAPIRPQGPSTLRPSTLRFLLGEGCFFGLCPVGDGRTYGFANIAMPRTHEPMVGRLDRLRRCFAGFGAIVQEYLAALDSDEQIHCGPIDWIALDQWHSGRVVLIGDAAHASSPMMGQGGCMAMEDACVLAECLCRSAPLADAFNAYTLRRRPRVNWVHEESQTVAQSFRLPASARNEALRQHGVQMFRRRFAPLLAEP